MDTATQLKTAFVPTNAGQQTALNNALNAIPVDTLNTPAPTVPPAPLPPTPSIPNTGANVDISANTPIVSPTPLTPPVSIPTTDQATQPAWYQRLLDSIKPTSATDTMNSLSTTAGIDTKQTDYNTKQQALLDAQANLTGINARLSAINANANAIPIQNQQNAQGRGITVAGEQPITAAALRENALKAIPLQTEALVAQAGVAAAQGNAQLAQSILQQAQDHVDKTFQIQMSDAQNEYNYKKDIIDHYYDFATKEQQAQLDAKKTKDAQDFTLLQNNLNNGQSIATEAMKNGQGALAAKITSLDPKSPTYVNDLAKLQSQVIDPNAGLDTELKRAQLLKLQKELNPGNDSGTVNEDLHAYGSQYADTGKLPSPAALKLSGLNIGQVTSYAKQLPKPNGSLVSTNTGTKSSAINADEESAITASYELLNNTLPRLKELFPKLFTGVLGGLGGKIYTTQDKQDYNTFRQEFLSKLLLARSGKVVSPAEYDRYSNLLPTTFNQPFFLGSDGSKKLNSLETSIKTSLDNTLNDKQLSIYGYSKVDVNGTQRTVGEVLDIGGTKYKVLPDGTLTDII